MDDRVVITGVGLVSSLGHSVNATWEALLAGQTGVRPIGAFDARGFECRCAATVEGLDGDALGIHPRDNRIMGKHTHMLMKACRDAYGHASLADASLPREAIGFFAGMGMVDYAIEDLVPAVLKSLDAKGGLDYEAFYGRGYREIYPLWPLSMLNNIGFSQVVIDLDLQGENAVFSPHAESGVRSIVEAMGTVCEGRSRAVLAGGVSEVVSAPSLARAHLCGIVGERTADPGGSGRPRTADREEIVLGEGCGVVVLELESRARERGVPCLASIIGYGMTCEPEGRCQGPTTRAMSLSMRGALEQAEIAASSIDLILACGDGSIPTDGKEIEALRQVFSDGMVAPHVCSSRRALGLLLSAAPVVDLILGVRVLETGLVPLAISRGPVSGERGIAFVSNEPRRLNPERILINSQSYEGQAASLIVESIPPDA